MQFRGFSFLENHSNVISQLHPTKYTEGQKLGNAFVSSGIVNELPAGWNVVISFDEDAWMCIWQCRLLTQHLALLCTRYKLEVPQSLPRSYL